MDPSDPRRETMPYIDDEFDEYYVALFYRFMGSDVTMPGLCTCDDNILNVVVVPAILDIDNVHIDTLNFREQTTVSTTAVFFIYKIRHLRQCEAEGNAHTVTCGCL